MKDISLFATVYTFYSNHNSIQKFKMSNIEVLLHTIKVEKHIPQGNENQYFEVIVNDRYIFGKNKRFKRFKEIVKDETIYQFDTLELAYKQVEYLMSKIK